MENPYFSCHTYYSPGFFYTTAAYASLSPGTTLASRFLFGDDRKSICHAGVEWAKNYIPIRTVSGRILQHDDNKKSTKEYPKELKPLFSAFGWRTLAITCVRSFLMNYLPIFVQHCILGDDDEEEDEHIDLVDPLKRSVQQIIREISIVTITRVLERFAGYNLSERITSKFLKDVLHSTMRKASREMPRKAYIYRVTRTTFRGNLLAMAASWLIQVGIEIYQCLNKEVANNDNVHQIRVLGKKLFVLTIRYGVCLAFISIGAGIGSTVFHPVVGQWIGCGAGYLAGPLILALSF